MAERCGHLGFLKVENRYDVGDAVKGSTESRVWLEDEKL